MFSPIFIKTNFGNLSSFLLSFCYYVHRLVMGVIVASSAHGNDPGCTYLILFTILILGTRINNISHPLFNHISYYELQGVATAQVSSNQPLQGHLSLTTHSPKEMQIRWISSFVSNPMVQIGTTSKQYTHSFTATYSTYNTSQMCGSTG
eukprot:548017_1